MNTEVKGYCNSGNEAVLICTNYKCRQPSLVCTKQSCKCTNSHDECNYIKLKPLITKLFQKAEVLRQPLYRVLKWYEDLSKKIIVQQNQIKKRLDTFDVLDKKEQLFLNLVGSKDSKNISGELTSYITQLGKKETDESQSLKKMFDCISTSKQMIDSIFMQIRKSYQEVITNKKKIVIVNNFISNTPQPPIVPKQNYSSFQQQKSGITPIPRQELNFFRSEVVFQNQFNSKMKSSINVNQKIGPLVKASSPPLKVIKHSQKDSISNTKLQKPYTLNIDQFHKILNQCEVEGLRLNHIMYPKIPENFIVKNITLLNIGQINQQLIKMIGNCCPKICCLIIGAHVKQSFVDDICVYYIIKEIPKLKSLKIISSLITDIGAIKIAEGMKELTKLSLKNNPHITKDGKTKVCAMLPHLSSIF